MSRDHLRERKILLDEENRDARLRDAVDGMSHLFHRLGREPLAGLVEQQHARARHQGTGQR